MSSVMLGPVTIHERCGLLRLSLLSGMNDVGLASVVAACCDVSLPWGVIDDVVAIAFVLIVFLVVDDVAVGCR